MGGIDPKIYDGSITDSLATENPTPRWYLMLRGDEIIGSFGLIENDFMVRKDLVPWLCALYVEENERGKGLGGKLLEYGRREAAKLGFSKVYLCTDHEGFYERYGWQFFGLEESEFGGETRVYEIETKSIMADITIRAANSSDYTALAEYDKHISPEVMAQKIERGEVIAAFDGDTFIGWLRYGLFWDNTPFMNLLYVLNGYRGQGVGKALTMFWEEQMRSQGYSTLMTSTQQNETAQHFYERLGYNAVGGFVQTSGEYELIG